MTKKILWISGILAAIAVFVRGSVILGLFLGVLPGLILAAAPTAFLYTAGFALLRRVLRDRLPIRSAMAVNVVAAALTIALGFAVTAPSAFQGRRAVAAAVEDEVTHAEPVRLEGDVRLERFGEAFPHGAASKKPGCDALCAALLDTPGIRSVTLGGVDRAGAPVTAVTFRLVSKEQSPDTTLMPTEPAKIVEHLPMADPGTPGSRQRGKEAADARESIKKSVTAKWSLRLAGAESLIDGPPPATFDRMIVIRDVRGQGPHRITVTELEIADAEGQVLLRRHRVTAAPVGMPFHLTPSGPMMDRGFEIGRSEMHTGPRYFDFTPVQTLFRHTTLARPAADEQIVVRLRETLAASAATSAPSSAALLVTSWLATLDWQRLDDRDVDVLARLIADPKADGLARLYHNYETKVSPRLRRPIAIRLLDPATDDSLRGNLNTLVRNMPPGTYATLLPEEKALLADPALRLRSSALVARLADQGPAAVPLLLDLLTQAVQVEPWAKRHRILADIRRAVSALARDAASALPTVERLFEARGTPLTNTSDDAQAWRVAMVRMGKPVETLTFPAHLSPELVARDREQIRKQADKGPER